MECAKCHIDKPLGDFEQMPYPRKTCKRCRTKRITEYRKGAGRKQSTEYQTAYRSAHKEKALAYHKAYREINKESIRANMRNAARPNREIMNAAKSVPCVDCKQSYPPYVMDFDHVRGQKIRNVSTMLYEGAELLKAEIAKCEVVCANCHRKRTHSRGKTRGASICH